MSIPPDEVCMKVEGEGLAEEVRTPLFHPQPGEQVTKDMQTKRIVHPPHPAVLSGSVIAPDGSPVKAARVWLGNQGVLPEDITNSAGGVDKGKKPTWRNGLFSPAEVTADASGVFSFDELYAGTTDVWAFDPKIGWGYVRGLSTDSHDVRVQLKPQPEAVTYTGHAVDAAGKPLAGAAVQAFITDNTKAIALSAVTTDNAGHFQITIHPKWEYAIGNVDLICKSADGTITWKLLPPMSADDVEIRAKQPASISGRVVDSQGKPIAGAAVSFYEARDPDLGRMFFTYDKESITAQSTSGSDGRFTLRGIPKGATVSLRVRHPSYGIGDAWSIACAADDTTCPDVQLPDGITLSGVVRLRSTGQPMAGATVHLDERSSQKPVTTDAHGRYTMAGLDRQEFSFGDLAIIADAKNGTAGYQGVCVYANRSISAGDTIDNADILVDESLESRQATWLATAGAPAESQFSVALLDDCDPAFDGKAQYDDTISILESSGKVRWSKGGLNICQSTGANHALAVCPDGSVVVCETVGKRLIRYIADGSIAWAKPDVDAAAVAVDPATSRIWALISKGTIYGDSVVIFGPDGSELRRVTVKGYDIAYSPHDKCFWVAGQKVWKVDLDGNVIAEAPTAFAWCSMNVAVNALDGSVWVAERRHPQVAESHDRLWQFSSDAQPIRQIDRPASGIALDETRGVAWIAGGGELCKLSFTGEELATIPINAFSVAVEPDTGYAWTAAPDGVFRTDTDGWAVYHTTSPAPSQKWLVIIPPR
jgi:protocatechuate 3,4-dioxygenase beta subunit